MVKTLASDDIETILSNPGSSDLPANIAEIEKAFFKARFGGGLTHEEALEPTAAKLGEILRKAGVSVAWDLDDLAKKIGWRFTFNLNDTSWIEDEHNNRLRSAYARMRDRPQIANLEALYGVSDALCFIAMDLETIEEFAHEAQDYSETASWISEDFRSPLAFVLHATELLGVEVSKEIQLKKLPGITEKDQDLLKKILVGAKVERYSLAIRKSLQDGAAITAEPKDFGLDKTWVDPFYGDIWNRDKIIRKILRQDFCLEDEARARFRDVAKMTGLPYSEVIKASLEDL